MIISYKYKFIFIKTNKTAGTSIEIALSKFCNHTDVITAISLDDEELRKKLGYRGPQNTVIPYYKYSLRNWSRCIRKLERIHLGGRASVKAIKNYIGIIKWNEYYKFCFERNPWDRVVSLYYFSMHRWKERGKPRISISDFIDSKELLLLKKWGIYNYTLNGEVMVDRVCLYENLEQELEEVCNKTLGIPEKLILPSAKSGYREDKRHYREILSAEDKEKIAEIFFDEISLFGYEY